jgi:branched-chain amino acid aminotransferase
LGATKAGANYAASLQAGLEAKKKGYAQVLWLDVAREGIEEVGTMNVFFVFKDEIVTPALNGSILPGCVRDTALHLLRDKGSKVSERRVTIQEVAEKYKRGELLEAFGTGTAAVISPIGELAYHGQAMRICGGETGPVARELQRTITDLHRGRIPDRFGWMKPLKSL